jgi:hypothetical protein
VDAETGAVVAPDAVDLGCQSDSPEILGSVSEQASALASLPGARDEVMKWPLNSVFG